MTITAAGRGWKTLLPVIPASVPFDSTYSDWEKSLLLVIRSFLRVHCSTPRIVTGRSPYSLLFGGREIRGKIPQFNYSVDKNLGARQRDVEAKCKTKTCADMKANSKKCNIQEGDLVLFRQQKRNNLNSLFETTQ